MTSAEIRVAFQGELGAYSDEAIGRLGERRTTNLNAVPMRENRDVVLAVSRGDVELGVLPLENTLAGSVVATYDALTSIDGVHAVGEIVLAIHHCALGLRGATLSALRSFESHPVALAQCAAFLARHSHAVARPTYDTAGSAHEVSTSGDPARGAIASRAAAARYRLEILATDIEDRHDNQTRFVVLSRIAAVLEEGTAARSIVTFSTRNVPGALYGALEPFAKHGINVVKLESRPTGEPWTYRFILECVHAAGDAKAVRALDELEQRSASARLLGTYAAGDS